MRDGRRLRRAVVSASAALSTCAALALPMRAAAVTPARPASGPLTAAAHRPPPRPAFGHRLQGDIVPGRAPVPGRHEHARRQTDVTKVLVVLGYWDKHDSTTPAQAKKVVITEPNDWYRRASYGHQGLTGTATTWLKIPRQTCGALDSGVVSAAKKAADKAHYHSSNYDRIVLYEPCTASDGAIGIGNLPGSNVVLMRGGMTPATAVHEQGHNYGLGHANQLICTKGGGRATYQAGAACKTQVYEDFSSAMSSQWSAQFAGDFTAPQKDALGWLAGHVQTVSDSRAVTLNPFESTSGTHAIKIPGSQGRTYWVEYRTATGNDAHLPAAYRGVLIHLSRPDTTNSSRLARLSQSLLLHTLAPDPAVHGFDPKAGRAYLPPTSSWTTPDGIKITLTSQTSGAAHIAISRGAHTHAPGAARNIVATALDASASVSFSRAPDNGLPISSYTITAHHGAQSGPNTTITDFTGKGTLHAALKGLTNDQLYTFSIRATNEAGAGATAQSDQVKPTKLPPTAHITSPTGGDVHDIVTVNATGTPNSVTHAKITGLELDVDGFVVDTANASPAALTWDTGDPGGLGFAQNAAHTITVIATDANGRHGMATVSVNLTQSTGPTLSLDDIAATTPSPSSTVKINVTAQSRGPESAHDVVFAAVRIGSIENDFPNPAQNFTAQWDTATEAQTGNNTIVITARDRAGRLSVVSKQVTVDNPSVSITAPAANSVVHNLTHIFATVQNNSPVDGVIAKLMEGVTQIGPSQTLTIPAGQSGPVDFPVDMQNFSVQSHTFKIVVTDNTNRSNSLNAPTVSLKVDHPPVVAITNPNNTNPVVHDTIAVTGTLTLGSPAGAGNTGITIKVDGDSTPTASGTTASTNSFSVNLDTSGLTVGTHTLHVTATDTAGVTSTTSQTVNVQVDHPPVVTLSSPADSSIQSDTLSISGTIANGSPLQNAPTVDVQVDAAHYAPTVSGLTNAFSKDLDASLLSVASHTITVTATDSAGVSTSVSTITRTVKVDHPPVVTISAPTTDQLLHTNTVTVTGTVSTGGSPNPGSTSIAVSIDGTLAKSGTTGSGSYSVTGVDLSGLTPGSHSITVIATDAAGVSSASAAAVSVKVDHPPVVTVTAPANDVPEVSGIVHVTGTVTNGAAVAGNPTVTAAVDASHTASDSPTVAQGASGNYDIALDLSDLTGDWVINVSATDASGITTTTPVGVEVTVVAPAGVSVSTPLNGDPAVTTGTVHFEGMATNHAGDAQVMTVHITEPGHTADQTFDVDPAVGADSSGSWARDVPVTGLSNGLHTFTVTASYPFGGTSTPVTVMVDVENP